jgi:hypothetical protein
LECHDIVYTFKLNYLRNRPRGRDDGLPLTDKINTNTNIQQQTDKIATNAMYILLSLSVDSDDGPVDGPVDVVKHCSVLHSLSSIVELGHAVPP